MGGLIGTVNNEKDGLMPKDGFFRRGSVPGDGDANNYTISGIWWFNGYTGNKKNFPSTFKMGFLIVYSNNDGNVAQEAISVESSKKMVRGKTSSKEWSEWV